MVIFQFLIWIGNFETPTEWEWSAPAEPDSPSCSDQVWPADKLSRGEKQLATLFATEKRKRDPWSFTKTSPLSKIIPGNVMCYVHGPKDLSCVLCLFDKRGHTINHIQHIGQQTPNELDNYASRKSPPFRFSELKETLTLFCSNKGEQERIKTLTTSIIQCLFTA